MGTKETIHKEVNITEQQLLKNLKEGDKNAPKALYDKFVGSLAAVCSRYIVDDDDVKDVLQESFIKIFTQINTFTFHGEGSLKAWMTRIVVNMSINFIKASGKLNLIRDDGMAMKAANEEEPDADGVPPDALQEMIKSLPDGYRAVLNLYVFENKSHKEIATLLNIKPTSSASQLYHAKAIMAKKIKEYKQTH